MTAVKSIVAVKNMKVLSSQEQFILETIDAIKDPKEKIEQLNKYLNLLKEPKKRKIDKRRILFIRSSLRSIKTKQNNRKTLYH